MNKMGTLMPKVRNVNTIILIMTGTLFYSANAQINFIGTYCIDYDINNFSNCLTFESEKKFRYEYVGDTGMFEYGQGEYQFIENHLILNYNRTEPLKTGYHISKIWTNAKDSINLQIHVFDFDGVTLPAVSVVYNDSLSKYGFSGMASNEKGLALINLKRDRNDLQVKISNLGFKSYKFSIDKNYNYNISVYLQKEGDGLPIINQIDTIQIEQIKSKYFTIKNKNGSITTWRKNQD